jgi:hypothetical protein
MRRPIGDHLSQPWRVHEQAADFELLDVWRFPVRAGPEISLQTFLEFVTQMQDDLVRGPGMAGKLFRLRGWLGRIFRWDDERPRAVRDGGPSSSLSFGGFESVYLEQDESLFEIENATVHALMHLGRIRLADERGEPDQCWSPQMAVYVKPRGVLGRFYMTLIGPFRHLIVYPAMMRAAERAWPGYVASLSRE